jgi:hypothetical protein
MGTKEEVSKNRSVGLIRTQVRYRGWGRRKGLRAYNRPEITPPGGRRTPIDSLYFLEGTGTPPNPGRQPAPERRRVMLRAGSRRQASLRKTDAVGVRENLSSVSRPAPTVLYMPTVIDLHLHLFLLLSSC